MYYILEISFFVLFFWVLYLWSYKSGTNSGVTCAARSLKQLGTIQVLNLANFLFTLFFIIYASTYCIFIVLFSSIHPLASHAPAIITAQRSRFLIVFDGPLADLVVLNLTVLYFCCFESIDTLYFVLAGCL